MRVLVACEFSGVVREAFRSRGHEAVSCDLLDAIDHSRNHIKGDVLSYLSDGWDLLIAHPPCTWLCSSSEGEQAIAEARSALQRVGSGKESANG